MSFSHTQGRSFSSGSSTVTSSKTYTGSGEVNIDETVEIGANTQINVAVDVSALKSLYIKSDVDCNIFVNDPSTGAPTKTINLVAEEPYTWPMGGNTNPLGATDVTEIFVTNAAECNLQFRALVDSTP